MDNIILDLLIKSLSESITAGDILNCERLQESVDCDLIDYVSGCSLANLESLRNLVLDCLRDNPEYLLDYKFM